MKWLWRTLATCALTGIAIWLWLVLNPPPEKIEIIIHSGTPEERILEGKLLAIDRDEDLAVIRIKAADLLHALAGDTD